MGLLSRFSMRGASAQALLLGFTPAGLFDDVTSRLCVLYEHWMLLQHSSSVLWLVPQAGTTSTSVPERHRWH